MRYTIDGRSIVIGSDNMEIKLVQCDEACIRYYYPIIPAPRLRVRRVYEENFARRLAIDSLSRDKGILHAAHGGGVNNSYGYPAETEYVVGVGLEGFGIVLDFGRLPANKVTLAGVAREAGYAPAFDRRCSEERRRTAADRAVRDARLLLDFLLEVKECEPKDMLAIV